MKSLIVAICVLVTGWTAPLAAGMSHELSIQGSPIKITVFSPEGFSEEESADLDLLFQYPEDKGRRLAFHYFFDSEFDLKSFNDVTDYTNWLAEHLFPASSGRSQESFRMQKDYAIRSFVIADSLGTPTYCYMYLSKIEGELVFANISTSYSSLEDAIKDSAHFLEAVFWKKE